VLLKLIQVAHLGHLFPSALVGGSSLQNSQEREGSDRIISTPTPWIFHIKLADETTITVLRWLPVERAQLILRGAAAPYDQTRQSIKPIPFNGFGVFCRVLTVLIFIRF
jgi:hypothetical protein